MSGLADTGDTSGKKSDAAAPASPQTERFLDSLRYDDRGLIPAIAQDETGAVLMMAWMNRDSLRATIESGQVVYWSRSRQAFWRKGETSGNTQRLIDLRVDCDRDCLLMVVDQTGPACHTQRRSCFYTALRDGAEVELMAPEPR